MYASALYTRNVKLMLNALNDKAKYEYLQFLAIMSCNPGHPECFLGQCGFCPGTDAIKQKLIYELEEKGLETARGRPLPMLGSTLC